MCPVKLRKTVDFSRNINTFEVFLKIKFYLKIKKNHIVNAACDTILVTLNWRPLYQDIGVYGSGSRRNNY